MFLLDGLNEVSRAEAGRDEKNRQMVLSMVLYEKDAEEAPTIKAKSRKGRVYTNDSETFKVYFSNMLPPEDRS